MKIKVVALGALGILLGVSSAFSFTVSQLTAFYQNGQVFLTWTNPGGSNLQYKVYRSANAITNSSQLSGANYLGYVRDNSSQNIRKSQLNKGSKFYFVIKNGQSALTSNQGLYVVTCTDNSNYYYAVTVTTLSNGQEDKTIHAGSNSLSSSVNEAPAKPQPVLQTTTTQKNGDISSEYVIWGNNQSTSLWPAFNNVGSYGYNFTLQKRGNASGKGLYVQFQDENPFAQVGPELCADGNILQLDDWLPNGYGTYWVGYNDQYNMYITNTSNPIVTSGVVHTYTQNMVHEIIRWGKRESNIDSTRVYTTGTSHNGFGAMLTTETMPAEISCCYPQITPILYKAIGTDDRQHEFCKSTSNIPTDVNYPGTSNPILIWDFCNMIKWYRVNYITGIPYSQGINGKNDTKVGWVQKFYWYDSLNATRQGGTWYWDQRTHSGSGQQFLDSETSPDYTRYTTINSYPAFSYCSINQNPGSGNSKNGAPYGAVNGYLDWVDNSIDDQTCTYSVQCIIKTFMVGGVADQNQYDTCTTDITFRRLQNFKPLAGQMISWTNKDVNGNTVQSGNFVFNGYPLTITKLKINKSGSTISLGIGNCPGKQKTLPPVDNLNVTLVRTANGYNLKFRLNQDQQVSVRVFDLLGRIVEDKTMNFSAGENLVPIGLSKGVYIVNVESPEIHYSGKVIF